MSLFKILKGSSERISTSVTPFHDGWMMGGAISVRMTAASILTPKITENRKERASTTACRKIRELQTQGRFLALEKMETLFL